MVIIGRRKKDEIEARDVNVTYDERPWELFNYWL